MTDTNDVSSFIRRCEQWLCDGYSYDLRYIATSAGTGHTLFDAVILLNPLPHTVDTHLFLEVPPFLAGREPAAVVGKGQLLTIVNKALSGVITIGGQNIALPMEGAYRFHLGAMTQNTWFQPLTFQVLGATSGAIVDRAALDSALRAATPPFDGAEDLRTWLGLRLPDGSSLSSITILANPPVDFRVDLSGLAGGILRLVLHAHPNADRSQVRLAVRAVPGDGLQGRLQVADNIVWQEAGEGRVERKDRDPPA